ncbi:DUF4267 domain-containing protein [Nocardia sp. 2]|uniref:DUF4267 domain-containing protein n=1 Tax=Nocardia acididurans TaxID=2802282 RepID=A0ABS1M6F5_9NOCA|nr:DUF4267 domain-containing protein [Nocardia acididurans]
MTMSRIATALTLAGVAFVFWFGTGYLFDPQSMATGFGLPAWPTGEAEAFLNIKGVRDVVTGLVLLTLLVLGQRYALGITMAVMALIPLGDGLTIVRWDGDLTAAITIHWATMAAMLVAAALLLLEHRTATTKSTTPAPVTA